MVKGKFGKVSECHGKYFLQFLFAIYVLLTAPVIKNSNILAIIYFNLKKVLNKLESSSIRNFNLSKKIGKAVTK